MDNPISNLIERIKEVNEILAHCADTDLSFDEAYKLAQFYYDYLNTNSIIDDAKKIGMEQTYIARVEKGKTDLQLSSFFRIAAELGIQLVPTFVSVMK